MSADLARLSEDIWAKARKRLIDAITSRRLKHIRDFVEFRRGRGEFSVPSLVVVERRTRVSRWLANAGNAELVLTLGVTSSTLDPDKTAIVLSESIWEVVKILTEDRGTGGLTYDVRVDEVIPDASSLGPEVLTQPWALATVVFEFDFTR